MCHQPGTKALFDTVCFRWRGQAHLIQTIMFIFTASLYPQPAHAQEATLSVPNAWHSSPHPVGMIDSEGLTYHLQTEGRKQESSTVTSSARIETPIYLNQTSRLWDTERPGSRISMVLYSSPLRPDSKLGWAFPITRALAGSSRDHRALEKSNRRPFLQGREKLGRQGILHFAS